jgi:hypothetical protein
MQTSKKTLTTIKVSFNLALVIFAVSKLIETLHIIGFI